MKIKTNQIYIYKEKTNQRDYKIAIKTLNDTMFNIASFDNEGQLELFRQTLSFKIKQIETINPFLNNEVKIYVTNYKIIDNYFWKIEELPKNAKPILALSNGSIVTCYYSKNYKNNTITIYRPNPNAKDIYKPLKIEDHISHHRIFGTY